MATKVTSFDRETVRQLRNEVETALQKVGVQYGVAFQIGTIRFNEKTFSAKLNSAIVNGAVPNTIHSREVVRTTMYSEAVKRCGAFYGVDETMLGRKVNINGNGEWTFVGINTRAKSMPFIYENINGRRIKAARNYVNLMWKPY